MTVQEHENKGVPRSVRGTSGGRGTSGFIISNNRIGPNAMFWTQRHFVPIPLIFARSLGKGGGPLPRGKDGHGCIRLRLLNTRKVTSASWQQLATLYDASGY